MFRRWRLSQITLKGMGQSHKYALSLPIAQPGFTTTVKRTLPYLYATISIMVQVQRLACMRPFEVCRMKVGEIDTTGEIWIYRPVKHKGTWRGHGKAAGLAVVINEIARLPAHNGDDDTP